MIRVDLSGRRGSAKHGNWFREEHSHGVVAELIVGHIGYPSYI